MKRVNLFITSLLLSVTAQAHECDKARTQLELNQCYDAQYQKNDKALNQTYKTVMSKTPETGRELLKSAQQTWIKLRDADCKFIASGVEGGSVQPMIYSQCLADKTAERTVWLTSLMQCEEGDLSCPPGPQQN